jgi:hypothetical protein
MSELCALVDVWLSQSAKAGEHFPPPDDLVAHVVSCPRCRVALVALLADLAGPLRHPVDQACEAIEAQIPAFVEYERAYGLARAARAFP